MKETFIKEFKIEDLKICDDLITYFKENNQYKQSGKTSDTNNQVSKKSTDVYVFNRSDFISTVVDSDQSITTNRLRFDYISVIKSLTLFIHSRTLLMLKLSNI